ncbi:MAG: hypothetical protein JSU98_01420 [Gemmatimonadales bacterium]|jgi:hypothetical protein|nr:MAG: hypothetical protein JSU98_01420 [Gemmatimonadales bacterium]
MPRVPFDALPDDSRLWVFPVPDPLEPGQVDTLLRTVEDFLHGWAAHGAPLTAGYSWEEDRFLLVAVDQASVPPSGCSIDSMVRVLKELEGSLGQRIVDHGPVYYRDSAGEVHRLSRKEFRAAGQAGSVTPETPVFDSTLTDLGAFRAGRLEVPARESWHGAVFF